MPLPPAEPSPRACPRRDCRGQRQDALLQPQVPSALLLLLLLPVGGSPRDLPSLDGAVMEEEERRGGIVYSLLSVLFLYDGVPQALVVIIICYKVFYSTKICTLKIEQYV